MALSKKQWLVIKIILFLAAVAAAWAFCAGLFFIAAFSGANAALFVSLVSALALPVLLGVLVFRKKRKIPAILFGLYLLLCAGVIAAEIGWESYKSSLPVVSASDFALNEYDPFTGEKTAKLDGSSSWVINKDFPKLDGATAMYPVYAAFARAVMPELKSDPGGYKKVSCTNTPFAYKRVIEGDADIIFVLGPSDSQLADAREAGVEFKMTPIGKEAFVFFVNKDNPVDNLTLQQVKDIYAGRIKNWKKLGGKHSVIRAFQRPDGSGSQTTLQNLMRGDKTMQPRTENVMAGMGGIIERVAVYRNFEGAVGFSFRFFLEGMVGEKQVKMLSINGVYPSEETIKDGSYPLTGEFYAVTTNTANPNVDKFIDWMLGPQGQELVRKSGYVPVN